MAFRLKMIVSWGIILFFSAFSGQGAATLQTAANKPGALLGFVYEQDGTTPIQGVKVVVKNVTTGAVFESGKTDTAGVFKLEGLARGVYAVGVSSADGSFNSCDFIGIAPGEIAKASIALKPYSEDEAAGAALVASDHMEKDEAFVGRVVKFFPERKEAEIIIERGLVAKGDRIHIKSDTTNIYQKVKMMVMSGVTVERVRFGQSATIPVLAPCRQGDFVYVVCRGSIPPIFLAPLGVAAIVAGSAALVTLQEEEEISPFRIKK